MFSVPPCPRSRFPAQPRGSEGNARLLEDLPRQQGRRGLIFVTERSRFGNLQRLYVPTNRRSEADPEVMAEVV